MKSHSNNASFSEGIYSNEKNYSQSVIFNSPKDEFTDEIKIHCGEGFTFDIIKHIVQHLISFLFQEKASAFL